MSDFGCPKKSMFTCAWCHSKNTFITMKNADYYDHYCYNEHKFPNGLLPYPMPYPEEKINYSKPFFVIIKCDDCYKFSSVKSIICKVCHHTEVSIKKISNGIDPEEFFDFKPHDEQVCKHCKYHKPVPYCEHSWIRVSGERFSECNVFNLVCKKCGKKKTTYSNQDTYLNPWTADEFIM